MAGAKRRLLAVACRPMLDAGVAHIIAATFAEVALCAEGLQVLQDCLPSTDEWDNVVGMQFHGEVCDPRAPAVYAAEPVPFLHLQAQPRRHFAWIPCRPLPYALLLRGLSSRRGLSFHGTETLSCALLKKRQTGLLPPPKVAFVRLIADAWLCCLPF